MRKFITGLLTLVLLMACSVAFGSSISRVSTEQKLEFYIPTEQIKESVEVFSTRDYSKSDTYNVSVVVFSRAMLVPILQKQTNLIYKPLEYPEKRVSLLSFRTPRDALNYRE